jgi:uncharacterized protein (DUF924 family)
MTPEEVLGFWFGAPGSREHGTVRTLWFTKSDTTDALIRERFRELTERAIAGELDEWATTPRGALALIIVLDQFTRNIHRDTPRAFAGDAKALKIACKLVYSSRDRKLQPLERWFAYMPFEHSERLIDQYESVRLFEDLASDGVAEPLDWAIKHFNVVKRFGRFPHRNEILGRASTPEEVEFLKEPGSRF